MFGPRRLLSLAPNISMILFALEADDLVVGRTAYCLSSIRNLVDTWGLQGDDIEARFARWAALPEVAIWPNADAALVQAAGANLILMSETGADAGEAAAKLGFTGEIVNFDIRTLDDLGRQIADIGELLGKHEQARAATDRLAAMRDGALSDHIVPEATPTVLFEYCVCIKYHPDPAQRFANPGRFVMAGGHLAPELIRLAGGEPLFADAGTSIAWTDFRDIRQAQPDMILVFDCGGCPNAMKHPPESRKGWPELQAMADGSVYRPTKNIANPNLCYPRALAEFAGFVADWAKARRSTPQTP